MPARLKFKVGDVFGCNTIVDGPFDVFAPDGKKNGVRYKIQCAHCKIITARRAGDIKTSCRCQMVETQKKNNHPYRNGWTVVKRGEPCKRDREVMS